MKKKLSIVGGGTAGLFLAAFLDSDKFEVTIYEKKTALGRKFLVAGDGGFNLTHGEELSKLKTRYTPDSFLNSALDHFSNQDLIAWLSELDIPTFVGSSGKVFPEKGIKPIEVLKKIKELLIEKGVKFEFNKTLTDWSQAQMLEFNNEETVESEIIVFALGGASWKVTGSDGSWLSLFEKQAIKTVSFRSSNCAFEINWPEKFIKKHEGKPIKNIATTLGNKTQVGECVVTKFGIEGNGIYGLSPIIQDQLKETKEVLIHVDFKPIVDAKSLIEKITQAQTNITTSLKEKLKLSPLVVDLIKQTLTKEEFLDIKVLVNFIKHFPLKVLSAAPIDEAISTAGGVSLDAINDHYELIKMPSHYCIGEMLNWDAPTGGYLIQACASMSALLAVYLNKNLASKV